MRIPASCVHRARTGERSAGTSTKFDKKMATSSLADFFLQHLPNKSVKHFSYEHPHVTRGTIQYKTIWAGCDRRSATVS